MSRVVLAMSGGVDSSVAAHLLLEAGHEVIGLFMRHGEDPVGACATDGAGQACETAGSGNALLPVVTPRLDHKQGCCSASDAADARRVADRLDIPFYALNLDREFGRIIDYFVDDYTAGRTPNPCVVCNTWLKFGKLFDYADSVGAQYVATGHYAQLVPSANDEKASPELHRGVDDHKDQSYVLFGVDRSLLSRMLLPVGRYSKGEIRELAAKVGLAVADKRDSQEICFVPSGKHADLVRARRGDIDTTGDLVTTDGRVVGQHDGIERFTIGQRKRLGVAMGEPHFVVRIEAETKRVVIGKKEELERTELTAAKLNWLADIPSQPFRCHAKIRYNSPAEPATATLIGSRHRKADDLNGGHLKVVFDRPASGVAPGQAVVCYNGDRVLGGGWIE